MNHLLTGRYFHSNVQFSNMRLKNLHVKNIRLNLKRIHVFCSVKKRRFLSFCSYFVRNLLANSAVERTLNSIYSIHSTDNNIPGRDYSLKFIARIYIWTLNTENQYLWRNDNDIAVNVRNDLKPDQKSYDVKFTFKWLCSIRQEEKSFRMNYELIYVFLVPLMIQW